MLKNLVILGAGGDLTSRLLLPAVANLDRLGLLPKDFRILGTDIVEWTAAAFRDHVLACLREFAPEIPTEHHNAVLRMLHYLRTDVTAPDDIARLVESQSEPRAFYLALPPAISAAAIKSLASVGVGPNCRLVVEKPFGVDLQSARELNALVHVAFEERAVFRIDHFLGKQTVQNILGLRFANRVFEPIWNSLHIERVDIVWDETLTIEGRKSYDQVGALRDMVQNHLMQLLCLTAMEAPPTLGEADLRGRKVDLLRAVRRMTPEEVGRLTVRGRYTSGNIGARAVPSYVDEPGIESARQTETFAQVTLFVDNWRWSGVPFTLRTGKALAKPRQEIIVRFKPVPHLAFGQGANPVPNELRIGLTPDRISLSLNVNSPDQEFDLQQINLDQDLAPQDPPPYGLLLLDVLEGDPTLSIRDDEIEQSWDIVDRIAAAWKDESVPLLEYAAGSAGPGLPR